MIKCAALLASAVAAFGYCSTANAGAGLVLEPSSVWNLRYEDERCRLLRTFGENDQKVELHIEQAGLEPFYTVGFFGEPVRSGRGEIMSVQFGPGEKPTERSFLRGKTGATRRPLVIMHGVTLAPFDDKDIGSFASVQLGEQRETAIEYIALDRGLSSRLRLNTGSMGEPLAAMRDCAKDLVAHLGLDEESQESLSREVDPTNMRQVTRLLQSNYPTRMLYDNKEGLVAFRLVVDRLGKPVSCQIMRSTRPIAFDDVVCLGLMQNAEFEPALDADGKPIASYFEGRVKFEIR